MSATTNILDKLKELVGQEVSVAAGDDCGDDNGIYFWLFGKLEAPEDGYNRFYLRVADSYHGTVGIGFHPDQVEQISKGVYIYKIELKERLNASY